MEIVDFLLMLIGSLKFYYINVRWIFLLLIVLDGKFDDCIYLYYFSWFNINFKYDFLKIGIILFFF